MAANVNPISPLVLTLNAFAGSPAVVTANIALDGSGTVGTTIGLIMTAGLNGSRVNRLRIVHKGSNVATVLRIFLNNGLTNAVASNNSLVSEITMAANTLSQVAASVFSDLVLNMVVPAGYKLYYTVGTTVVSGYSITAVDAGDY